MKDKHTFHHYLELEKMYSLVQNAVLTNDPFPMCDKMIGVTIEDGAIIGARAVIKAGVTIGKK